MMEAVASAFGLMQAASDVAKSMMDLRDAAIVREKVIELQGIILSAQQSTITAQAEQAALIKRVSNLEDEIARSKAWEAEKARYELTELPPGIFVRSLKQEMAATEPAHQLCEKCYQDGLKSILNRSELSCGQYHLKCTRCGADHLVGRFVAPQSHSRGGSWMGR